MLQPSNDFITERLSNLQKNTKLKLKIKALNSKGGMGSSIIKGPAS